MDSQQTQFSAEAFFETQEPPVRLSQTLDEVKSFIAGHAKAGRRVVLVTSGGTTVPLEHNVVRFLDNFSAGTRGAASAEQFLRTGEYAVIFLHRQHSLQPFSRHYSHSTNPFLDLLEPMSAPSTSTASQATSSPLFPNLHAASLRRNSTTKISSTDGIQVRSSEQSAMMDILKSYKLVQSLGLLHSLPFVTVFDYLFLLRGIAQIMGDSTVGLGRRGLYYLAAAVSDFFLPQQKMSRHKIQSGKGSLVIEMDQVPKVLRTLVQEWNVDGMIVSFKLETDRTLLIPKARQALERYGHQIVIGNDLATRKNEVVFVQKDSEEWLRVSDETLASGVEIEESIIERLVEMHTNHMATTTTNGVL